MKNNFPSREKAKEISKLFRPQEDKLGEFWRDGFMVCYDWITNLKPETNEPN